MILRMALSAFVLVSSASISVAASDTTAHDHSDGPGSMFGSPEIEAQSLAENLDSALKICEEITLRVGANEVGSGNRELLATQVGMLNFNATPPEELIAISSKKGPARYGKWFDPHAEIWMIAYTAVPYCRIHAYSTYYIPTARPFLVELVQKDKFWQLKTLDTGISPLVQQSTFEAPNVPEGMNIVPALRISTSTSKDANGRDALFIAFSISAKK